MGNAAFVLGDTTRRIRRVRYKNSGGVYVPIRTFKVAAGEVGGTFVEPTEGLFVKWTFDDGTLVDSSGAYTLTSSGSVGYGAGIVANAVQYLTGSSTTYTTNSTLINNFLIGKPWSVSLWVYTPNAMEVFKVSTDELGSSYPSIFVAEDECSVSIHYGKTIGPGIDLNVWQHIAATYDGAELALYINGVKSTHANSYGASSLSYLYIKLVGSIYPSGFGLVDQVRLYNRQLSDEEVLMLKSEQNSWRRINV